MAESHVHVKLALRCHQQHTGNRHQRKIGFQPESPGNTPLTSLGENLILCHYQR